MTRTVLAAALLCAMSGCHPVMAAQQCEASHYGHGDGYNGRRTANGEVFNTYRHFTAAMRKPQPFGSYVTVTNLSNCRSVRVLINDRGPWVAAGASICLTSQLARLGWVVQLG